MEQTPNQETPVEETTAQEASPDESLQQASEENTDNKAGENNNNKTDEKTDEKTDNKTNKKKKDKTKRTVFDEINSWVASITIVILLALVIRSLIFEPVRVDGASMNNTLNNGDLVLVTKPKVLSGNLERGDIVICHYPGRIRSTRRVGATFTLNYHTTFIKRLIALPGDSVAISGGVLYVNDTPVDEPDTVIPARSDMPRITLKKGEYFVIGDNRNNSHDSRSFDVGPITEKMIVGHVAFRFWPLSDFGPVK